MTEELWRKIPGFPIYEVSNYGQVRRNIPNTALVTMKQTANPMGYMCVSIRNSERVRSARVHVLVLEAFVSLRPAGLVCCHNDSNPANNRLSNLRWDTQAENNRQISGKAVRRFTSQEVRNLRISAKTHTALAREYGVSISHMANIRNGEIYGAE